MHFCAMLAMLACVAVPAETDVVDLDNDGFPEGDDCNDVDLTINPGAAEICNGLDDDCSGSVDDDAIDSVTAYTDADDDGYGSGSPFRVCEYGAYARYAGDCDDLDAKVNPRADELCNARDDDCNEQVDDYPVDMDAWYIDDDKDGFGTNVSGTLACKRPPGLIATSGDCEDDDPDVNPGATELCNGADDDCDRITDSDAVDRSNFWPDADADGHGAEDATGAFGCAPPGTASDGLDCDDADRSVSPSATEYCNGWDDDCDGALDNADPSNAGDGAWYEDRDGDGFGAATSVAIACAPPAGFVRYDTDCDDATEATNPTAAEICDNGVDDDCDGGPGPCRRTGLITAVGDIVWTGGTRAADLGDLDGDGASDLLVWGSGERVSYVSGTAPSGDVGLVQRTVIRGSGAAHFGEAAAPVGDVTGDGTPDVLVGAPYANTYAGSAFVLSGTLTGDVNATTAATAVINGSGSGYLGGAVGTAGDVDGDGIGDVIIGAPWIGVTGQVYLFLGGPTLSGTLTAAAARATVTGLVGDDVGEAVAGGGDADADGIDDVVACAPSAGNGSIVVVSGDAVGNSLISDWQVIESASPGTDFGESMSFVGDDDGDGYDDLVVAASAAGVVYLFAGPLQPGTTADAASALTAGGYRFGDSLSGGQDFDGDGQDDLAIAAPSGQSAWVVYGPLPRGSVALDSTEAQYRVPYSSFGDSVAFADANGDGTADLIVTSPVTVIFGSRP